jgi:group I intron endonuclease
MNDEMSTTKKKEVIWDENHSTEPRMKSVNNGALDVCDTTININVLKENEHLIDTTKTSGIYKIINKQNNMYYIGSSDHIHRRWKIHRILLNKNRHENLHLQNAWNKYGENAFDFIIVKIADPSLLLKEEQEYLNICKTYPLTSYNISYDAVAPMRGRVHLLKSKRRMSETHIGKLNPMFGKHTSNYQKNQASIVSKKRWEKMERKHKGTQKIVALSRDNSPKTRNRISRREL